MRRYFTIFISFVFAVFFFASCNNNKHLDYQGITFDYPENWTVTTENEEDIIYIKAEMEGDNLGMFCITGFNGSFTSGYVCLDDYLRSSLNVLDEQIPVKIKKYPIKNETIGSFSGKSSNFTYKDTDNTIINGHLFAFVHGEKTFMVYYTCKSNCNLENDIINMLTSLKIE